MWIDWQEWNVTCARLMGDVQRLVPNALIRFDFLGEGWGCSVLPDGAFADGSHEAYGQGLSPRSAIEDVLDKIGQASQAA